MVLILMLADFVTFILKSTSTKSLLKKPVFVVSEPLLLKNFNSYSLMFFILKPILLSCKLGLMFCTVIEKGVPENCSVVLTLPTK